MIILLKYSPIKLQQINCSNFDTLLQQYTACVSIGCNFKKGLNVIMNCRLGCGACCIAPSISTPIPGMPDGKPAGVRCVQLSEKNLCLLFESDSRPAVCESFQAEFDTCGATNEEALINITSLEKETT